MLDKEQKSSRYLRTYLDFCSFLDWTSERIRASVHSMKDIDPARIDIVQALRCLEDAHLALMPGQAPKSTEDDVLRAIAAARPIIQNALSYLEKAEKFASED